MKNALQHATAVRQQIFELASIKERATLESFGIYLGQESDSSTDEDSDSESGEASFDIDVDLEYNSSGGECGRCSISEEGGGVDEQADCGESDGVEGSGTGSTGNRNFVGGTADNTCTTQENSVQSLNHERDKSQRHVVDPDNFSKDAAVVNPSPSHDHLLTILRANQLNWFAFVAEPEQLLQGYSIDVLEQALLDFSEFLPWSDLSNEEDRQVEQSRQAYLQTQREKINSNHGEIYTDSESDDPEAWVGVDDALSSEGQALIRKHRAIIRRKAKREISKEISSKRYLMRKVPKKVSRTVARFPNIGRDIEEYVKGKRVGADQWRRTGVLTFDGN